MSASLILTLSLSGCRPVSCSLAERPFARATCGVITLGSLFLLSSSALAQGLSVNPSTPPPVASCPANPPAVVNNGGVPGGLAISGDAGCPAGTNPAAEVTDNGGIAIGNQRPAPARTLGDGNSIAIGNGATAGAAGVNSATAIGRAASATGMESTGFGALSAASGNFSTAIGIRANAAATDAVALGAVANAVAERSTAIGSGAQATGAYSAALGAGARATGVRSTAVGEFTNSSANKASSFGSNANATAEFATAVGSDSTASGERGAAFGAVARAEGNRSVAVGEFSLGLGAFSTAVGSAAFATNELTSAFGASARAEGAGSTAIGQGSLGAAPLSTALGTGAFATGERSISLGAGGRAESLRSVAVGAGSLANAENSTALGARAAATTANSVALGADSNAGRGAQAGYTAVALATPQNSVGEIAVGGTGARQITGVAAGSADTDAVNVSQLSATLTRLGGLGAGTAAALGGGAAYNDATGTLSLPTYQIQGATYHDDGSALSALDGQVTTNTGAIATLQGQTAANTTSITDVTNSVTDLTNAINSGGAGLVRQVAPGANITIGAATDGSIIDVTGTTGARAITGVAAGAVATGSTDAINGAQLAATNQAVTNLTTLVVQQAGGGFVSDTSTGAAAPVASGTGSAAGGAGAVASAPQSTAVGTGAQASGANSVALGAGSTDGGTANVVSVGSADNMRRITNLGAGTSLTDAVNLSQLNNAMNQGLARANAYTDSRINALNVDLKDLRHDSEGSTAAAMALAGIPQSFEAGMGMIGMGAGTWMGESAVAFGASKAANNGRVVFKVGATYNTRGQGGANGGVGFAF